MQNKNTHKNISIDGPAASGKTTLGEELALRINYKFLDTGLMYRFVAFRSLLGGIDVNNEKQWMGCMSDMSGMNFQGRILTGSHGSTQTTLTISLICTCDQQLRS